MATFIKIKYNDYIEYNINNKNNILILFDPNCGLTDDQIHFLLNPNLKDIIIGFDMDSTLHQTYGFINKPLNVLLKYIRINKIKNNTE